MQFTKDFLKTCVSFLAFSILVSMALFIVVICVSFMLIGDYEIAFQNGIIGFKIAFLTSVVLGFLSSILMAFLCIRR